MDLLEEPEIKKTYDKCKYIVKVWEHKFIKKHRRVPSKLDIRESSREVRNAYKKYFQLKTAALEQSFMDVEGFDDDEENIDNNSPCKYENDNILTSTPNKEDINSQIATTQEHHTIEVTENMSDVCNTAVSVEAVEETIQVPDEVWGAHLNHKNREKKTPVADVKQSMNLSITQKLFGGSKFMKRNPRKSLSFSQKIKSDTISGSQQFSSSQPTITNSFTSFTSEEAIFSAQNETSTNITFRIATHSGKIQSQPVSMINSILENNSNKPLKTVDTGWLERVIQKTGTSIENPDLLLPQCSSFTNGTQTETTKLDYDSEDIIEESDEEISYKDTFHIAKKKKIDSLRVPDVVSEVDTTNNKMVEDHPPILYNKEDIKEEAVFTVEPCNLNSQDVTDNKMVEDHPPILYNKEDIKEEAVFTVEPCNLNSQDVTDNKMVEDHLPILYNNEDIKQEAVFTVGPCTVKSQDVVTDAENPKVTDEKQQTNSENKMNEPIKENISNTDNSLSHKNEYTLNKVIPKELPTGKQNSPTPNKNNRRPKKRTKKSALKEQKEQSPEGEVSPRRSSRRTKVKMSLQEFSSDEDPFHTDTDEKDPEFNLDKSDKKSFEFNSEEPQPKSKKGKPRATAPTPIKGKRKRNENKCETSKEDEETEESKPYEREFSIKPRIVTPRYGSIKTIIAAKGEKTKITDQIDTVNETVKDKNQQAKSILEKKISSGKLNENFVRINIKKKVFVRGKSGRSFSKFKKAQWRSNKAKALAGPEMDMGGCDGGMLTCFNCGQIGHFARNCKATKGDGLLPLSAENEEQCPYPSLEEASQMAKQSILSVRMPNINIKRNSDSENEDNNEPSSTTDNVITHDNCSEENIEDENIFDDDFCSEQLLMETLRLEEQMKKLDVRMYMDSVKVVEPYFKLNDDNTVIDTPPEVYACLEKFGHSSFRPGQEQAIMRILSGKSTLVTLSTGSGKSLCYQLPAYLYSQREPCISLIISPLVSLMDDQIMRVAKFMKAACLHSNQTKTQRQKILEAITLGELSVLLVSPEAVVAGEKQTGFGSFLRKLPPIAFACIDEAHCVSQWSHNFRPSYLMICRVLRENLGVKTILGLTATATRATRDSIIEHLQIPDGDDGVISDIPLPDNLLLTVSKDKMRDHALLGLLMSERFASCKSVIVYCTRRNECERIATYLRTCLKSEQPVQDGTKKRKRLSFAAEPYHAGLSASRRKTIQNAFMSGELRIVVATVAFGMGIDKSDIRAVVHYNMPSNFESYVQEVGRAGRDGLKAYCHVFLDSQGSDENELRRHIYSNAIDRHVIRKLLQKVFIPCSCTGKCPKHEVAFSIEATERALDVPEENISTLLCYLQLHPNRYLELASPAYTKCKIVSYGGAVGIRKAAKDCPPLTMALALYKPKEKEDQNVLDFPVVDVASAMGWESGICKHKLKNLEWVTVNNQPKRSTISVQFSDLGFRLFAPGNLSENQLDEALDDLYKRVGDQEQKALLQLNAIHKALCNVAKHSFHSCITENDDIQIKSQIREYFNSPNPLKLVEREKPVEFNEEQLVKDIHALICMYKDNSFNGRAIARIFHGIPSPNYPAVVWWRCKFWRSHIDKDFHTIVKIATREIIKMR